MEQLLQCVVCMARVCIMKQPVQKELLHSEGRGGCACDVWNMHYVQRSCTCAELRIRKAGICLLKQFLLMSSISYSTPYRNCMQHLLGKTRLYWPLCSDQAL